MEKLIIGGHKNASCYALVNDGVVDLISYTTFVARYDSHTGEIDCTGTYSNTTRKHIGWFAKMLNKMYGTNLSYDVFKSAYKATLC